MSATSLAERSVRLALRCYPRWWRDRYGPDQAALVEDLKGEQSRRAWLVLGAWRLAGSFVVGAVRARLSGFGMPAVPALWQRRAHAAIIAASVSAALAAPLALLLIGRTGQYLRSPTGSTSSMQLSTAGQVASWDVVVLSVLCVASILQLAGGALRMSREVLSLAPPRRRVLVVAAALAPVVAVGAGFLLLHLSSSLRPVIGGTERVRGHMVSVWYSSRGEPLAAAALFWTGWTAILGGWVGGALMLARMATHRCLPLPALVAGVRHARAVTLLQGGVALCALTLVVTLPLQGPVGPAGGAIYRSELGPWTPVVCTALLAVASITWGASRAARRAVSRAVPVP